MASTRLRVWLAMLVFTALPYEALATDGETGDKAVAIPAVQLTVGHDTLCHVRVGNKMPTLALPSLDGVERDPDELFGDKATVVVLWQGNRPMTRTLIADLGPDILERFSKKGIAVVGVAIKQDMETTRQQLTATKAVFPVLLDVDGAVFAQVGKKMLPRVYVLDVEGQIVWFDIEYSQATRRELGQTLRALTQ